MAVRSSLIEILFHRGDVSTARLVFAGVTRQTAALRELDRDTSATSRAQNFSMRELIKLDLLQPPQWIFLSSE
jgi:hypothetical protein